MTEERLRREPPRFRRCRVAATVPLTARMVRLTLTGPELVGLAVELPAASVRLLVPGDRLELPAWNGNEFLLADGSRPVIRTFTPRRSDPAAGELDLDVVIHGSGAASAWAEGAQPGAEVAVSGPGRGYVVDPDAPAFLLAGDETAIPAVDQLLEVLPPVPVQVLVEVARPDARRPLTPHPHAAVEWLDLPAGAGPGDAMAAAVLASSPAPGTKVWVAGEAAAVQRIRRHLFEERGMPRSQATVRGYWKHGRSGGADDG